MWSRNTQQASGETWSLSPARVDSQGPEFPQQHLPPRLMLH